MIKSNILITFLTGLAGSLLFFFMHLPLPWILGPAFAIMILNASRPGITRWPRWISDMGIIIIAYLLGRKLTSAMALQMLHDLPWMLVSAVMWLILCLFIGLFLARIANISLATGVLGCVPGGLSQMVLIADDIEGADAGTVALIQTTRLVIVLYTVPFLAALFAHPISGIEAADPTNISTTAAMLNVPIREDWPTIYGYLAMPFIILSAWGARRLRIPGGDFLGPFAVVSVLAILGCSFPAAPDPLVAGAQFVVGIYIGSRVQPRVIFANKRLAPIAIGMAVFLVSVTVAAAWILSKLTQHSIVTWFLSLAPGGLNEVAVTALVLNADVTMVTAFQVVRIVIMLLLAPPLLLAIVRMKKRSA